MAIRGDFHKAADRSRVDRTILRGCLVRAWRAPHLDAFTERLRLIRFRRKREHTSFRDELRIIPKWLVVLCLLLYILALIIGGAAGFFDGLSESD